MQDEKILLELARLILPSGFVENFKIIGYFAELHNGGLWGSPAKVGGAKI